MTRPNRRRARPFALALCLLLPALAGAAEERRVPPEKTYSNTPFFHRIQLRDEDGNLIAPPAPGKEDAGAKPFSTTMTCGKCHDYPAMSHGWHFNSNDATVAPGRKGEPWILTDVQTRTQIPLSYRRWDGTFHPHDIGMNDVAFVRAFGSHLPGGAAAAESADLRFKMSGKLEIDCLMCHTNNGTHDPVSRANQITSLENFKWAPTVAAQLGEVLSPAAKLKDTWDPTDPDAKPAPKVLYKADRFVDKTNNVVFNVSGRVSNDRCYFCHTNLNVGKAGPGNEALEKRWNHDRDIHIVKGMLCVDCHKNGVDHMTVRGYDGEAKDRKEPSIASLSCAGCHMGSSDKAATGEALGGRNAAPRPAHKGLPVLHFDKLTCTACHSGPWPDNATTMVQTSLAHRLGLPRHHHEDDSAPTIQQTLFLRNDQGKIAPHKALYPSFWGKLNGERITPLQPEFVLAAGAGSVLGQKPNPQDDPPLATLTKEQIAEVLTKIAAYKAPAPRPSEAVMGSAKPATPATAPTTAAATAPATAKAATPTAAPGAWTTGEPVFVTGGKAYKRNADGKDIEAFENDDAAPYAWAMAHDVRGAQQALGARGCTDCHAAAAPVFEGTVSSAALLASASTDTPMHDVRGESMGSMAAFASSYPMRPLLIFTGYACAALLALVLIAYGARGVSALGRRRD